ncbi:hypothetical protein [Dactylosporangium sp. CA-233914]|uniref:hypothetical protein n=1 Tax=Dactylosporangium sp. CA-233914 TaxID=3239934 RepID=UPI003D943549
MDRQLDGFGIGMLHPAVGKQWCCAWGQGSQRTYDGVCDLAADPELVMCNGDFTAVVFGAGGPRAGQMRIHGPHPRIYVRGNDSRAIPPGIAEADKWHNVEITFYAYSTAGSPVAWAGLEAVARTNHFPDDWQCTSGGYGARMLFDGRIDFEKEVYHAPNTNFQTPALTGRWTDAHGSVAGRLPLGRWIGFKFVVRNIDAGNDGDWRSDRAVHLELYRDLSIGDVTNPLPPADGGDWELVAAYTDLGRLSSGTPCTHRVSPDDDPYGSASKPFLWPNYSVYLRTDGLPAAFPQYYKWFSVREIAPAPDRP